MFFISFKFYRWYQKFSTKWYAFWKGGICYTDVNQAWKEAQCQSVIFYLQCSRNTCILQDRKWTKLKLFKCHFSQWNSQFSWHGTLSWAKKWHTCIFYHTLNISILFIFFEKKVCQTEHVYVNEAISNLHKAISCVTMTCSIGLLIFCIWNEVSFEIQRNF